MSPDLFSYCSEIILREADGCRGVVVGSLNLTNIHYAVDTVLLASSERELQHLLDVVIEKCQQFDVQRRKDRKDGNIENLAARY